MKDFLGQFTVKPRSNTHKFSLITKPVADWNALMANMIDQLSVNVNSS